MDFSAKYIPNIDHFSEKVHIIDQSLLKWTDLGALVHEIQTFNGPNQGKNVG